MSDEDRLRKTCDDALPVCAIFPDPLFGDLSRSELGLERGSSYVVTRLWAVRILCPEWPDCRGSRVVWGIFSIFCELSGK